MVFDACKLIFIVLMMTTTKIWKISSKLDKHYHENVSDKK